MPLIFFAAPALWPEYRDLLPGLLAKAGISATVVTEAADPASVDYIIYAPSAPCRTLPPSPAARPCSASGPGSSGSSAMRP